MKLTYAILDPRNLPVAAEVNDKVFQTPCGVCDHSSGQLDGQGCPFCGGTGFAPVLGIEVTVPALAARCNLGNIDPQHGVGGTVDTAAIEVAVAHQLPPENAVLVTVRPDLDSVGAMAVMAIRARGESLEPAMDRIRRVADSDKFAKGGWPGVRELPSANNLWPEAVASIESSSQLAAIAAAVADFKVALAERVAIMEKWLLTGEEPSSYRIKVDAERTEMVRALDAGEIQHQVVCNGRVAVVESAHRAATMVGYALAPVVVAVNPSFRLGGGESHRKITICAFTAQYADIKSALVELGKLEAGWGGSPTIGGSPQGVSTNLSTDQVVEVVARYLK